MVASRTRRRRALRTRPAKGVIRAFARLGVRGRAAERGDGARGGKKTHVAVVVGAALPAVLQRPPVDHLGRGGAGVRKGRRPRRGAAGSFKPLRKRRGGGRRKEIGQVSGRAGNEFVAKFHCAPRPEAALTTSPSSSEHRFQPDLSGRPSTISGASSAKGGAHLRGVRDRVACEPRGCRGLGHDGQGVGRLRGPSDVLASSRRLRFRTKRPRRRSTASSRASAAGRRPSRARCPRRAASTMRRRLALRTTEVRRGGGKGEGVGGVWGVWGCGGVGGVGGAGAGAGAGWWGVGVGVVRRAGAR